MMHGHPLSATLPADFGLDDRFWYWHGASGQRYIHSIYRPDLCPRVDGAVYVVVAVKGGVRRAVSVGRFGSAPESAGSPPLRQQAGEGEEIHVHLLSRDDEGAIRVLRDLLSAMSTAPQAPQEPRPQVRPVQLELLAA